MIPPSTSFLSFLDTKANIHSSWIHRWAFFLAASTVTTATYLVPTTQENDSSTQCCGIAGVIGTPDYDARYWL